MIFYLIGIDYKTVPLSIRESAYRQRQEIYDFWQSVEGEAAVLFTCNRVEVYAVAEDMFSVVKNTDLFQSRFPDIFGNAYIKEGRGKVIRHALRLASGLESQLFGEGQIMEQLKSWKSQDSFPPLLKNIWSEILGLAHDIRVRSALNKSQHSIAELVLEDLIPRVSLNGRKKVVVIGTGKIAQLFAESCTAGINLYFVSRKKHSRARQLAKRAGGRAILMDDLSDALMTADVLISATSSPHYVLRKHQLFPITGKRKGILYIYDLAVPRDIEPDVKNIAGVCLQDLDDLAPIFRRHNQRLSRHVQRTEVLVERVIRTIKEGDIYAHQSGNAPQPAGLETD